MSVTVTVKTPKSATARVTIITHTIADGEPREDARESVDVEPGTEKNFKVEPSAQSILVEEYNGDPRMGQAPDPAVGHAPEEPPAS